MIVVRQAQSRGRSANEWLDSRNTYVLEGSIEHRDSMGNRTRMSPGDMQRMSAGTGVVHNEWNHSKTDAVHFLQIWIQPARAGLRPGYEQRHFEPHELQDRLRLIVSQGARGSSMRIHQDDAIYATKLALGATVRRDIDLGRYVWAQVVRGAVTLNGALLQAGDGAALSMIGLCGALEPM